MGQREIARTFYEKAIAIAPPFERAVLVRRMRPAVTQTALVRSASEDAAEALNRCALGNPIIE
jgi:hypothetical protein